MWNHDTGKRAVPVLVTATLAVLLIAAKSTVTLPRMASRDRTPTKSRALSACPSDMVSIGEKFCVDRYEASTVEVKPDGKLESHSPFQSVAGLRVKAVSKAHVVPQAYISRNEADAACRESKKRLC